jgi:surfeit locus 1 family protein
MLSTLKAKGLIWPAIATVAALVLLISLGNWQMRRLAWKEGLLAAIAERTHAVPVDLDVARARGAKGEDVEYLRVKAKGRFLNDRELHLYSIDERYGPGFDVITPLKRPDGSVVLVNRGFVPDEFKDASKRTAGQLGGDVEVTGLVRRPETAGTFTPANNADKNIWYWRDLGAMATTALGADAKQAMPFYVDAEAKPEPPGGWPKGGTTRLELPNRHLEYAMTWYGLAAALVGVFAVFAASRWQKPGE